MDRLNAMRVFVNVVDSGSLSAAADKLDMSRPVVTRYVAELEQWTGARLLHRTTRRLSLTAAGEELLPRCRQVLELTGDMQAAVRHPAEAPRGQLRITTGTSFAQAQLADAIADYVRLYPAVMVDLVLLDRTVNLVDERIDLAIRTAAEIDPNLIARRLTTCRSVVCASPAYLKEHGKPLRVEELAQRNCLTHSYFGRSLWNFTRKDNGEPVSVAVDGNVSANDAASLMYLARAGAGIACCRPISRQSCCRRENWCGSSAISSRRWWACTPCTPRRKLRRPPCARCSTSWPSDSPKRLRGTRRTQAGGKAQWAVAGVRRRGHQPVGVGNGHCREQEGDMDHGLRDQHAVGVVVRVDESLQQVDGADADDGGGQLRLEHRGVHVAQPFGLVAMAFEVHAAHEGLVAAHDQRGPSSCAAQPVLMSMPTSPSRRPTSTIATAFSGAPWASTTAPVRPSTIRLKYSAALNLSASHDIGALAVAMTTRRDGARDKRRDGGDCKRGTGAALLRHLMAVQARHDGR